MQNPDIAKAVEAPKAADVANAQPVVVPAIISGDVVAIQENKEVASEAVANQGATNTTDPSLEQLNQALAQGNVTKSNLTVNLEYTLVPNKNDAEISNPLDPAQIQAVTTQYSRMFKINNVEFSNASYKISFNGQVDYYQDDNMPSGFVTVKVEGVNNLVKYFEENLAKIVKKDNSELQTLDISGQGSVEQITYKDFLNKIVSNLSVVTLEIATKNQLSTPDVAVFDMRREKNLDFIINETSSREILGKF